MEKWQDASDFLCEKKRLAAKNLYFHSYVTRHGLKTMPFNAEQYTVHKKYNQYKRAFYTISQNTLQQRNYDADTDADAELRRSKNRDHDWKMSSSKLNMYERCIVSQPFDNGFSVTRLPNDYIEITLIEDLREIYEHCANALARCLCNMTLEASFRSKKEAQSVECCLLTDGNTLTTALFEPHPAFECLLQNDPLNTNDYDRFIKALGGYDEIKALRTATPYSYYHDSIDTACIPHKAILLKSSHARFIPSDYDQQKMSVVLRVPEKLFHRWRNPSKIDGNLGDTMVMDVAESEKDMPWRCQITWQEYELNQPGEIISQRPMEWLSEPGGIVRNQDGLYGNAFSDVVLRHYPQFYPLYTQGRVHTRFIVRIQRAWRKYRYEKLMKTLFETCTRKKNVSLYTWRDIKQDIEPHFFKRPQPIKTGPWKGRYMWSQRDENGFVDILKPVNPSLCAMDRNISIKKI